MLLNHAGVVNENEEQAVKFYSGFLGFVKTREFHVPVELSRQLFALSRDIKVIVFERDGIKLEVFICPDCKKQPLPDFRHLGLYLEDLHEVLERAAPAGVEHILGKTKEKVVHFIKDYYGNLIEVKQK